MQRRWVKGAALVLGAGLMLGMTRGWTAPELRFVRHELEAGVELDSAAVADFTGDRRPDVVAAGPKALVLHARSGSGWERRVLREASPAQKSLFSITLQAHDVDADGDLDVLTCDPHAGTLDWFENPGTAAVPWEWHLIDRLPSIHSQALQDLDGDGRPELVANTKGQLVWFAFPRDPRTASPHSAEAGENAWKRRVLTEDGVEGTPHYLTFARLQGKLRLLGGSPDGGYLAWWEQQGDRAAPWRRQVLRPMPGAAHFLPADINADGVLDLFFARGHTNGIGWLTGPDWAREEVIDPGTLQEPHALAVGDLNGDRAPEVVAAARKTGGLVAWLNDGHGGFTPQRLDEKQLGMDLRIADLDQDGDADLVVAGATANNLAWFENRLR